MESKETQQGEINKIQEEKEERQNPEEKTLQEERSNSESGN